MRDARDTCLSCYFHNFFMAFSTSLEELGFAYREYERLMAHYRTVLPIPMLELSYEQMVEEPERVTRELVAFCGLAWDERCLRFYANPRTVSTPSMHQVRQPVYKTAKARWRNYEKHLAPLIDALAGRGRDILEAPPVPPSQVKHEPAEAATRLATALAHHRAADLSRAEEEYLKVLETDPANASALQGYGTLLSQTGRHREAVDRLRRVLEMRAADAALRFQLGQVCHAAGLLRDAAEYLVEAIRLRYNEADAHNSLGAVYRDRGMLHPAIFHFRQAVQLGPDNTLALQNLGQALQDAERTNAALEAFQRLLALKPESTELHCRVASLSENSGRTALAEIHYREALRLRPGDALALRGLARVLEALGNIDEAARIYQDLAQRAPGKPAAFFCMTRLAKAGKYTLSESDLQRMEQLVSSGALAPPLACTFSFALGEAFDRLAKYDQAFTHFRTANDLQRRVFEGQGIRFQPPQHRARIDALIETFTTEFFTRKQDAGITSEMPIFIVGMPRSGTTLVEQILSSHPRVHGAGELTDISAICGDLAEAAGGPDLYPSCLVHASAETLRKHALAYLQTLTELAGGAARVSDKLPTNFMHLGLIAVLFPQARVIHCRRDPSDTCLSCYFHNFRLPFTNSLEHLGIAYKNYERLMAHWRRVLPIPIYDVAYEDLVDNVETASRALVAHCGLEWDPRCLDFHAAKRTVNSPSAHEVRRPVYKSSLGRWQHYAKHLTPLLDALKPDG
jgi:tetratricopeptide (TPR) repeat protein